jgi:hypothetical protein
MRLGIGGVYGRFLFESTMLREKFKQHPDLLMVMGIGFVLTLILLLAGRLT